MLTLVLLLCALLIFELGQLASFPLTGYLFFAYFFLLTAFLHKTILKANEKTPSRFVSVYTGTLGIKMLLSLVVAGIYSYAYRENPIPVVITFLMLYFTYTFFEVFMVLKILKSPSKNKEA